MLPLEGLTVLDLSRLLPGPYATLVLADLGAQVDKVEEPGTGDGTRHMPPLKGDDSAVFLALNRNKRSIALDLKSADGLAAFKKLVPRYDVLVESFRPGVMDKLGLSFEALHALNPRLIVCSISGYGQTGPDRLKAGHDLNYVARAGALGFGGSRDGAPAMPGIQVGDIGGALFGLVGLLAALHERTRTGLGRQVDVSMTEASLAFMHVHLAPRRLTGMEGPPLARGAEPLNGGFACYGVYVCGDGRSLAVGALEPKFSARFFEALGHSEWLDDAYVTGPAGDTTKQAIAALLATKPRAHWLELLAPLDACVEAVWEGDEVFADAQLVARGVFAGEHLRTPLSMGPFAPKPAPALGAHTEEILSEADR